MVDAGAAADDRCAYSGILGQILPKSIRPGAGDGRSARLPPDACASLSAHHAPVRSLAARAAAQRREQLRREQATPQRARLTVESRVLRDQREPGTPPSGA